MRKILYSLFVLTLFSGPILAQDTRVVYSETFETADDVSNWGVFSGATSGSTATAQNATEGVGGSGALKLTDGGFGFRIERPISATVGEEYLLTMDVKVANWDPATRSLSVGIEGLSGQQSVSIVNLTDFATVTVGGVATNSSGYITIFGSNGSGENNVWVDNIVFTVNKAYSLETSYQNAFDVADDVANWGVFSGAASGSTSTAHNSTEGVGGSGVLKFTDGGFSFRIERPVTATVGEQFLLTMDVKVEGWDPSARTLMAGVEGISASPQSVSIVNLTDFTTITLAGTATNSSGYIFISGSNGFVTNNVWIDNVSLKAIDMNTVVWNGSAWNSGATPTATDNVMVDGALSITGDVAAKNLMVTSNGSVTVESGASLAIMETATGNATIKRNTTGSAGYSIIGAPVSGADLSVLSANYLQTWNGTAWSTPSGAMTPGVGYFVGYDAASPEVALTGALVSGNQSTAVTTTGDGFNLVANPYASSISISSFLTANTGINSSVYFWNDGGANIGNDRAGDYVTVNSIGTVGSVDLGDGVAGSNTTAANTNIASMQGFFVQATAAGSVSFTPAMQTTTAAANADANFYRTAEQSTLKLALSGAHYNEVLFGFRNDATEGLDRLDAVKRIGNENFAFYSNIEEEKFAIQALPELNGERNIALGYDVKEAGTYELSIKEIAGIPSGYNVFATFEGRNYNLSQGVASLSLPAGSGTIGLTITSSAILSMSKVATFKVFNNGGQLNVQVASSIENANVQIFDMSGRTVVELANEKFRNGNWAKQIDLRRGDIYILRVESQDGMLTKKFIY
ncbi:MAG: T9SS type A sorting domain-containing protein [Cyclobacteriaceae bacterium]